MGSPGLVRDGSNTSSLGVPAHAIQLSFRNFAKSKAVSVSKNRIIR